MNELELNKKLNRISNSLSLNKQTLIDTYFFEQFIKLLSESKYKNRFVIKGGFLLQNIVGIQTRTTLDMDFEYIGDNLNIDGIELIVKEICDSSIEPSFKLLKVLPIKTEELYGGHQIVLLASNGHFKKTFSIDIGLGDIITPGPHLVKIHSIISEEDIEVFSYPIESIISEKIHALLERGAMNTRMKDYYDIYVLVRNNHIDFHALDIALINTFYARKKMFSKHELIDVISKIESSNIQREFYTNYSNSKSFANDIDFESIISALKTIAINISEKPIPIMNYDIEIHLVRHGEDDQEKTGGWSDNSLTKRGIKQVKKLTKIIDVNFDFILSSDLIRAKETARIISTILKKDVIYSSKFRETNNGDLKNLSKEQFSKLYSEFYYTKLRMDQAYPNGESPQSFFLRVKETFMSLLSEYNSKKVLLITHGGVITVILCLLNGYTYSNLLKITPPYASLIKIKIQNNVCKVIIENNN